MKFSDQDHRREALRIYREDVIPSHEKAAAECPNYAALHQAEIRGAEAHIARLEAEIAANA